MMDVSESESLDSEVNAAFLNLAKIVNLPRQVLECLILCGYDTIEEVAELTDAEPVEAFFRKNHHLFENSPKRDCIYGIYAAAPTEFTILPGHASRLAKFINLCKLHAKNSDSGNEAGEPSCGWPVASPPFSIAVSKCSSAPRSRRKRPPRRSVPVSESMTDDARDGAAYFSPGMPEDVALSPEASAEEAASDRSETGPPSRNGAMCTLPLGVEAGAHLKRKLKHWCSTHGDKSIQDLRVEQHYKVILKQQLHVDEHAVVKEIGLVASMFCCMCCTNVKLTGRKNAFAISNATRHLLNCVKNNSVRGRRPKSARKRCRGPAPSRQQPDVPPEDTGTIHEVDVTNAVEITEYAEGQDEVAESSMDPAVVGLLCEVQSDHDYDNATPNQAC